MKSSVYRPVVLLALVAGIHLTGCANGRGDLTAQEKDNPTKSNETGKSEAKLDKESGKQDDKKFTNALASETSPYLLLHAHNPVNWYAWNPESLAKAKKENKVIFLSIGYSSCHWCHVMERESFMDKEIAKILNENFICIKVDREERPDIDSIYMNALNVISRGRGGWPLSMFLTPEAKPFFGTTYMPARDGDRGNMPGFLRLITQVVKIWKENPETIQSDAEKVTKLVKERMEASYSNKSVVITDKWVEDALQQLGTQFDAEHGGFGFSGFNPNRPKFPEPSNLELLLEVCRRDSKNLEARKQLIKTLDSMAKGGIRDHVGGGFHRYSVDRFWNIPHFEKMLYDNGQLASIYAEAYALEKREDWKQLTRELLDFVLAEMTAEEGGFYSALDAESENEEGKFYRWTREEVEKLIGARPEYALFKNVYQLDRDPNFEEKFYALQFMRPAPELAKERSLDLNELESKLAPLRKVLFDERAKRARPLLDTKILASWNGLMIRGFADAGRIFGDKKYTDAAIKSAEFVLSKMRKDGRLFRTFSGGKPQLNAYLDDYAFMIDGMIAIYKATRDKSWLDRALELQMKQIELFWDEKGGGFYFTSNDHESLLARAKNPIDGARPSGVSVSANNLIYLGVMMNKKELVEKCRETIQGVANLLQRAPSSAPRMLVAIEAYLQAK